MIELLRFLKNIASVDEGRRLSALKAIADRLLPDYRLTWPQMAWWDDESFNGYLDEFGERAGFNTHRRWMLSQLLRLISSVPGNTAECGVFEGSSSWLICSGVQRKGRTHHLFDSFQGLSAPAEKDGGYWQQGDLAAGEEVVAAKLASFKDMIVFHKGWIPDRFTDVADEQFAFVHVDVDLRQPTFDSIEFFYQRLSPGGILLCDDYGFTSCPGATEAADSFLADKPEKMIALDAGGGFFIKGLPVEPATERRQQG